jgi:hypothetical protein
MFRGRRGRYPGNGPFRDLPTWQRPGRMYGYRAEYGRGYGYIGDPTKCARFPWLPRWWWTNPDYEGVVPLPTPTKTTLQEKQFLEDQVKFLEKELTAIQKRIDELSSQLEKTE